MLRNVLVLLDSNLRSVATVDVAESDQGISGVAVHGDQVIVVTGTGHSTGYGLQLLDLDGRFLRTIAARRFRGPEAVTASHGRVFVVDEDEVDDDGEIVRMLYIIDIESGDLLQTVSFELEGEVSAIVVDGDEIYIAGFRSIEGQVVVLQLAGSEA